CTFRQIQSSFSASRRPPLQVQTHSQALNSLPATEGGGRGLPLFIAPPDRSSTFSVPVVHICVLQLSTPPDAPTPCRPRQAVAGVTLYCTFYAPLRSSTLLRLPADRLKLLPGPLFVYHLCCHRTRFNVRMEIAIGAARWVVGRALGPVRDGLLESWAASSELGPNIRALKLQLLYAQAVLDNARGREVRSPALGQLLLELRHHAYKADDVLDELEYFRIQDEVEGTYETNDDRGLLGHARHTARAVASKLKIPSCSCATVCQHLRKPKLKFDRVEISKRMAEIVEQLKPVCAMVSTILDTELLGSAIQKLDLITSNNTTSLHGTALNPIRNTTAQIIDPNLYGRDALKKDVGVLERQNSHNIYDEVKNQFQVPVWICVSQNNFSATRLAQEIVKQIPEGDNERKNATAEELIEKRLQSKQFLLVLDDMWTYHEGEWERLLAPFRKAGTEGNMVLVTTRIPSVAQMVTTKGISPITLERLKDEDCMVFLKACVLGDQQSWEQHKNLYHIGLEIVRRLKGFPLAVKTISRLLKNEITLEYWTRVLDSKEWESQANDDDIMPALRLSYNYLPFNLQQCFSHCALFPEDYEFDSKELIHLWIGLGLLGCDNQNKRIEDTGLDYLKGLVNYGFFQEEKTEDGHTSYVIHDLLHDLAVNVSAYECLSLKSSNLRSIHIPASIRHLSITIEDEAVKDRVTFESCKKDLYTLGKRLKAENLRTLILFGDYHGRFCKLFGDIFGPAKSLRVIFLSEASYAAEDLLPNFTQLVHLRYLRIMGYISNDKSISSSIARFYNLLVLDLEKCNYSGSTREMNNLVKIRHFVVNDDNCHSEIYEVGKLKSIQELRSFEVKREDHGFELNQLGQLPQLQGSLEIYNLEKVESATEVGEANLVQMHHLNRLLLHWGTNESERNKEKEEVILESLKPHNNIREVCIRGHGGGTYPAWLGTDHSIDNLEFLCLNDVAWKCLPHLGELLMVDEELPCIGGQAFKNLKRLELVNISALQKWSTNSPFSHLEILTVRDCSELIELPFTHYTSPQEEQEKNRTMFPKLQHLCISNCSNLVSVPQIPWSSALRYVEMLGVGKSVQRIIYRKDQQYISVLFRMDNFGRELWNLLAFSNLSDIKGFEICECPALPLDHLQLLSSLKTLKMYNCSSVLWPTEAENKSQFKFLVEHLTVDECCVTGKKLAQLISYFPNLSKLQLWNCDKQKSGAEETEAAAEGLLLMPLQINELSIIGCPDVRLCSSSLQSRTSLTSLTIWDCPKFLSTSSCSSSYCPFPTSLQNLELGGVKDDMFTLTPLSNLTKLELPDCECLRSEDIWHLLAQGHLRELEIRQSAANIFDCSEAARIMQVLETDGEAGYPAAAPIRGHFSSSLTKLRFEFLDLERFTRAQSEALQLLTSLQELRIKSCSKLQSLPAGLSGLPNLKTLWIEFCRSISSLPKGGLPSSLIELRIWCCWAIRSLPKGTLPSSLMELNIDNCSAFRSLPKDSLPSSLTKLVIEDCPAIRSLHKDSLPSSLQTLDVSGSNEKLQRQCRKLKGIIPIVITDY
ncbi:hypothetical protein EJB05_01639, partial [Eragrostis curvula]